MEEKERYELNSFDDIYDNEFDDYLLEDFQTSQLQNIVNLLNQQDKQIKELEKENQQLKQQLALTEKALGLACERITETDKHKCKVCYSYGDDACIGYKPMCCEYIKKHFEWKAEKAVEE